MRGKLNSGRRIVNKQWQKQAHDLGLRSEIGSSVAVYPWNVTQRVLGLESERELEMERDISRLDSFTTWQTDKDC